MLLDVAISLVLGGYACRDVALIRSEPVLYAPIASDATISRTITALATDVAAVEKSVAATHAAARAHVWTLAGGHAPYQQRTVTDPQAIDVDATLIMAHSEKEQAGATFKHGYGLHQVRAFADHTRLLKTALAGLPRDQHLLVRGKVLVCTDGAGSTREFLTFLGRRGVSYSIGFTLPASTPTSSTDSSPTSN
ncbi:IS1380 family transposase ISBli5 [Austwickia sp. TVS 96-490-7B]|uniref:transposase n=1 Tax=Austwickia sp. TVS 96-490-7B TaxID=2830843 RepID=UPI001C57FBE7|nr:transposase [Austwickia sp. TVS 96-490-7B]MBW3085933.1 IS1380 family transposase ISBli5 [Austwickia sp. TVS 96-490-7B]